MRHQLLVGVEVHLEEGDGARAEAHAVDGLERGAVDISAIHGYTGGGGQLGDQGRPDALGGLEGDDRPVPVGAELDPVVGGVGVGRQPVAQLGEHGLKSRVGDLAGGDLHQLMRAVRPVAELTLGDGEGDPRPVTELLVCPVDLGWRVASEHALDHGGQGCTACIGAQLCKIASAAGVPVGAGVGLAIGTQLEDLFELAFDAAALGGCGGPAHEVTGEGAADREDPSLVVDGATDAIRADPLHACLGHHNSVEAELADNGYRAEVHGGRTGGSVDLCGGPDA